jgi:hypothetical protein
LIERCEVIFMAGTDYAPVTNYAAPAVPVQPSRMNRAVIAAVRIAVGLLWLRALVLGLLAVLGGWLNERILMLAAGTGFLLAAAVQLVLLAGGNGGFLGGNASTFSLWLGLGVGLITLGAVPEPDAYEAP